MNIHEHQAKDLLKEFGAPVSKGVVIFSLNEIDEKIKQLNSKEFVDGKGVVGETPILSPQESYTYKSGTFLQSNIGAMSGFFTMENIRNKTSFKVTIPTFNLSTIASLN